MEIRTKEEAQELGLHHFFTGEPCKNGHVAERNIKDGRCRECCVEQRRRRYSKHKEQILERQKEYYHNNKESRLLYSKLYQEKNKEKIRIYLEEYTTVNKEILQKKKKEYVARNKQAKAEIDKIYRSKNKDKIRKKQREWEKGNSSKVREQSRLRAREARKDPQVRLKENLRSRLYGAIKAGRGIKEASTFELLGCSAEFLRIHLESQFTKGMSWDNYGRGGWHIDHIKPCVMFDLTNLAHQRECFHYSNLQPLWEQENLSKGAIYDGIDYRKSS